MATARTVNDKRRQVFKHALEKPYTTVWPSSSGETQTEILNDLCTALQPLSSYFAHTRRLSKAHRRTLRRSAKSNTNSQPTDPAQPSDTELKGKKLLDFVCIGINSTTRALERQAQRNTQHVDDLVLVVVCKGDVEPQLVAHFPGLVHAARMAKPERREDTVRLVGVGVGAEQQLVQAVGQNRVSVVGIRAGHVELDAVVEKARAGCAVPSVPWIGMDRSGPVFYPVCVRELHTSAPIISKKQATAKASVKVPVHVPAKDGKRKLTSATTQPGKKAK
ncbi:RNase P and RNase MRP subunit [Coemansia sp. RSA 2131]|nr:RNase P and RNase MRP subunit [Coemansia sp. RSA 2131]